LSGSTTLHAILKLSAKTQNLDDRHASKNLNFKIIQTATKYQKKYVCQSST